MNLQPEFQRGEVWPVKKKQRLIDTILREWHVPPVHVIDLPNRKQEILDGQQRMIAIRDFTDNQFPVDGSIEPDDPLIRSLGGLLYSQLPADVQRQFDRYPMRVIRVTDYNPAEVGELFLRLNQPANLTTAEQRNAFFGPARSQIKNLVLGFEQRSSVIETLGFSNSRMAYDDVVARLCFTIEAGDLWRKVGANDVTAKYRSNTPFTDDIIDRAERTLELFCKVVSQTAEKLRFNKATLFSWLLFYDGLRKEPTRDPVFLADHLVRLEISRSSIRWRDDSRITSPWHDSATQFLLKIFNDRASARVSDVMSVILRDFVICYTLRLHTGESSAMLPPGTASALKRVHAYLDQTSSQDLDGEALEAVLTEHRWRPLS